MKKFQERANALEIGEKGCHSKSALLDKRKRGSEPSEVGIEMYETRARARARGKESQMKSKRAANAVDDSPATLVLQVVLDGKHVRMLLDGHRSNLSSRDQVSEALRSSGSPVVAVIQALEELSPPYLVKIGKTFEKYIGRSCILLLEQLIITSPTIESEQRERALKLAREWKEMLLVRNSPEVLAFLYLLASFDLAPSFDMEEVVDLFETVSKRGSVPKLCHQLGLRANMPGFIKKLVGEKQDMPGIEDAAKALMARVKQLEAWDRRLSPNFCIMRAKIYRR